MRLLTLPDLLRVDLLELVQKLQPGPKDGFHKLVLPLGHRGIIRALVKTHSLKEGQENSSASKKTHHGFDIIKGKGKGLIILLHGTPGVGKTSTAEFVAANTGRPLFPITCGDLSSETARDVERNLERCFDLARRWNFVLLLDEADVFLGTRLAGNIKQNALVSVSLWVLDYYTGISFSQPIG